MNKPDRKPDLVTTAEEWFGRQSSAIVVFITCNEKSVSTIHRLLRQGYGDSYNFTNGKNETEVCLPEHKVEVWYSKAYRYELALKAIEKTIKGRPHDAAWSEVEDIVKDALR